MFYRHTFVRRISRFALSAASLVLLPLSGCKTTVDDPTLTTNVKAALAADPSISNQPVQTSVQAGVVTLTGDVSDETASSVAAEDAAKVKGVKEVVNGLTVAGIPVPPTVTSPNAPTAPRQTTPQEQAAIANNQPLPPPSENAPGPPPPAFHEVTLPVGASIPVRITQGLDSAVTQEGTPFNGVVTHEVVADGYVAIPAGAAVSGRVVAAHDAGHFKGHSLLSLKLTALTRHSHTVAISTDAYTVEGKGRGTNTAEKIGGGAAIGAVLGGIFGGGRGAAIGAGAGAGGGAIVQGSTRGQQVAIASETVIRFHLANSITLQSSQTPSNYGPPEPGLQTR